MAWSWKIWKNWKRYTVEGTYAVYIGQKVIIKELSVKEKVRAANHDSALEKVELRLAKAMKSRFRYGEKAEIMPIRPIIITQKKKAKRKPSGG